MLNGQCRQSFKDRAWALSPHFIYHLSAANGFVCVVFFVLIGWLSLSITEASTPINNTHKSHNNFGDKSYYIIDINGNLKTFCTYQKCETDFIFGCIPFRIVHEY